MTVGPAEFHVCENALTSRSNLLLLGVDMTRFKGYQPNTWQAKKKVEYTVVGLVLIRVGIHTQWCHVCPNFLYNEELWNSMKLG